MTSKYVISVGFFDVNASIKRTITRKSLRSHNQIISKQGAVSRSKPKSLKNMMTMIPQIKVKTKRKIDVSELQNVYTSNRDPLVATNFPLLQVS